MKHKARKIGPVRGRLWGISWFHYLWGVPWFFIAIGHLIRMMIIVSLDFYTAFLNFFHRGVGADLFNLIAVSISVLLTVVGFYIALEGFKRAYRLLVADGSVTRKRKVGKEVAMYALLWPLLGWIIEIIGTLIRSFIECVFRV